MIESFRVSNFASFKDEVLITTLANSSKKELIDKNTFKCRENIYNKVSYIFGSNGSGKTNLFVGFNKLRKIIVMSTVIGVRSRKLLEVPIVKKELTSPIENFKFDKNSSSRPTEFGIDIIIDDILYTYEFKLLNDKVISEILTKKKKRKEVLIKRTSPNFEDIILRSELAKFKTNLHVVRENSLCLAMAALLNNELANKIIDEIMSYEIISMASMDGNTCFNEENTSPEYIKRYLKILKTVEPTLQDLSIHLEENGELPFNEDDEFQSKDVIVKNIKVDVTSIHDVFENHKKISQVELPFLKYESNGTIKLLGILPSIFDALDRGGVLFIDEIENGLHPIIVQFIINLFNEPKTNPNNAQLICSTHNTLLLENCRRDQVWFMEKNKYGESKISRLSDYFNVRSNDKVHQKYLKGVFGAIPNI